MKRIPVFLAPTTIALLILGLGTACNEKPDQIPSAGLEHLDAGDVKLTGEAGRRRSIQNKYLFRFQAGKLRNNEGYIDFEKGLFDCYSQRMPENEIRKKILAGYTAVGKTLDAAVFYAYADQDTALTRIKDHYIEALVASQDPDGYIGYLPHGGEPPLFTGWLMHDGAYICCALLDDYERFGNEGSLRAAQAYLDLVMRALEHEPAEPGTFSPVGITKAFLQLYRITGNEDYLEYFADIPYDGRFIEKASVRDWRQELFPRKDPSAYPHIARYERKIHTYRLFMRCLSQLNLNEIQPDPELEYMSDYVLAKMLDPESPGMYITGATGRNEGWVEDQDGRGAVGEACAVVHQIWWLSRLIEQRGDLTYGDLMERMILNHMFAAQNSDPTDGRTRYFVPLSGERNYNKGAHCCEGNTRRFWSRFPELVYFKSENCIAVNLYTPSILMTEIGSVPVKVVQHTDYPSSGKVIIELNPANTKKFSLRIRIPGWAQSYEISINGEKIPFQKINGGIEISRKWSMGDRVQLTLPMEYRWVEGKLFYSGLAALMRGPQVFCVSRNNNPHLDGLSLGSIEFDPESVEEVEPGASTSFRNGQSALVKGKSDNGSLVEAIFTDFPDINGEETYFKVSDTLAVKQDELLSLCSYPQR